MKQKKRNEILSKKRNKNDSNVLNNVINNFIVYLSYEIFRATFAHSGSSLFIDSIRITSVCLTFCSMNGSHTETTSFQSFFFYFKSKSPIFVFRLFAQIR